ncbi:molybdate ABC transporter substrate-binding protein [Amycolatopsis aidingensis]|uniref:molybdate ABC transporter substrate-binding protein n=1 Tax=Amycolatopsis aidingensis TaxID=2842453 RepID=UPI001C0E78CF|nr:molybdate ABC transporter substrate-binding protein [Amycolatopsis aidingensis]
MKRVASLLLCACLAAGACTAQGAGDRTVTVFAAASLTESFGALAEEFEAEHPRVRVRLNLAGSSRLAQQIVAGAPADVFASANEATMRTVTEAGRAEHEPRVFATNELAIAVAPGNPHGITSFADLARDELTVVVCAPQVPCGAATERVERASGVTLRPASEEQDVRAVLTKVQAGEADAGVVYGTDVRAAGERVSAVRFPEASRAVNRYPIAVLTGAEQPEPARWFTEFVLGPTARKRLLEAGFGAP